MSCRETQVGPRVSKGTCGRKDKEGNLGERGRLVAIMTHPIDYLGTELKLMRASFSFMFPLFKKGNSIHQTVAERKGVSVFPYLHTPSNISAVVYIGGICGQFR